MANTNKFLPSVPTHDVDVSHAFINLIDTPTTYSGSEDKYIKLTASGVEFSDIAHGDLTGLSDDDHSQYLLTDGSRPLSGDWNYGSASISGTGNFYGNGATLSGISYIDNDDVYFYDATRGKTLSTFNIQIGCGRNSSNTTSQFLRTFNGTPMNITGIPLPFDATLVGIIMAGSRNDQCWTAQVRKNNIPTVITSLSITNAYENHTWSENVDFSDGDRIQVRMSGTNINFPQVRLFFRRRK